jgi:hypothetical protein
VPQGFSSVQWDPEEDWIGEGIRESFVLMRVEAVLGSVAFKKKPELLSLLAIDLTF